MSEDCINKSIGRLSARHYLAVYPHNAAICHNMHKVTPNIQSQGDVTLQTSNFFRETQYYATYPLPWYPPSDVDWPELNGLDPSLCFVEEKSKWENCIRLLLRNCRSKMNFTETVPGSSVETATELEMPLNVCLLAEQLEKDPDDQFSGTYNWYYGNGNLDCIYNQDKIYIIKPDYSRDGILYLSQLKLENNLWNPVFQESYEISTAASGPIYQIHSSEANFLVRQKMACSLFRFKDESDVIVEHCNKIKSQFPFVCCSIYDENTFVTLTTNHELSIWNSFSKCPVSSGLVLQGEFHGFDKWGSVLYSDNNTLLLADRTTINLIDTRVCLDDIQQQWNVFGLSETCEQICGMASGSRGLQYIVTTHQMFGLDLRKGFTQRWTHAVPNSPSLVKVHKQRELVDTIFIGSLHSDTVVAIENRWDESSSSISRTLPFTLPSMHESLHMARCQGHCLSNIIAERFNMSLTGLCCIEDQNINVIRCSSLGDIFIQRLIRKNSHVWNGEFSSEECEQLNEWEQMCKLLVGKKEKKITVSDVKHVGFILEKIRDQNEEAPKFNNSLFKYIKPSWKISKNRLLKFCDNLAPKLLDIWDLEDQEEWITNEKEFNDDDNSESEEDNFVEKVSSWINTYATELNVNNNHEFDEKYSDIEEDDPDDELEVVSIEGSLEMLEDEEKPIENSCFAEKKLKECQLPVFQPQPKRGRKSYVSGF